MGLTQGSPLFQTHFPRYAVRDMGIPAHAADFVLVGLLEDGRLSLPAFRCAFVRLAKLHKLRGDYAHHAQSSLIKGGGALGMVAASAPVSIQLVLRSQFAQIEKSSQLLVTDSVSMHSSFIFWLYRCS